VGEWLSAPHPRDENFGFEFRTKKYPAGTERAIGPRKLGLPYQGTKWSIRFQEGDHPTPRQWHLGEGGLHRRVQLARSGSRSRRRAVFTGREGGGKPSQAEPIGTGSFPQWPARRGGPGQSPVGGRLGAVAWTEHGRRSKADVRRATD
jgi:hypothetical protein